MTDILLTGMIIISLAYTVLILAYAFFFNELNDTIEVYPNDSFIKVSIIIAARNESHCILDLLQSVKNQDYPFGFFEIIIIDDASTDETYHLVQDFAHQHPELNCKINKIENDTSTITYKKSAISKGIQLSDGELIITTDADCIVGPEWISEIVAKYRQTQAKMLIGLVAYHKDKSIFQKMQHLEFLSLIASGAAAVKSGFPIICNGANLVYERKAFEEVKGFDFNLKFASGDDVFLLLKMKKYFGNKSITVLNSRKTIVYTKAKKNLGEFTHQRIRWASKTKGYKDFAILSVAGIVFLFSFSIIVTLMIGIFVQKIILLSICLFVLKVIVDFPLMLAITKYINRKDLLLYYLPLQIVYLPYVMIIAVISNFMSFQWKGRTIK